MLEDREMELEYERKQKGINNRLLEYREMEALILNRLSGNITVMSKTSEDSKLTATVISAKETSKDQGKLRDNIAGRDCKKWREEDEKIKEEFLKSLRGFQPSGGLAPLLPGHLFIIFNFVARIIVLECGE